MTISEAINNRTPEQMFTNGYQLTLNPDCSLKWLEEPHVYNKETDNLYRLDEEALLFIQKNQLINSANIYTKNKDFLDFCIKENIFFYSLEPTQTRNFFLEPEYKGIIPSLRYVLIHLTDLCNLRCKHCYVAPYKNLSLNFTEIENILNQAEQFQLLTILLSGGEPLYYPDFWKINSLLPKFNLRFEMLSNGVLITPDIASRINFHHIQISIDGLEESHDLIRGKGNFRKSISGIYNLINAGKEVSIATMVFNKNLQDFDELSLLWKKLGIKQWIVNAPSIAGNWTNFPELSVSLETAVEYNTKYSYGEGIHSSKFHNTCSSHICTILATGEIFPCPLLNTDAMKMGSIRKDTLRKSWITKQEITLELTECSVCYYYKECKGGCRARAKEHGNVCGRDPVMCALYKNQMKGGN